jgi:alpha-glucoside transport system substrate-binding protein
MGPPRRRSPARRSGAAVRRTWIAAAVLGVAIGGCGANPAPAPPAAPAPDPACTAFQRYGDLSGSIVDIAETASAPDIGSAAGSGTATPAPMPAGPRIAAYSAFEACTGVRIRHRSVASVAEQVATGTPPDLGYLPDAAALTELVRTTGAVKPAPPPVAANVAEFYPETYRAAGSVDGTLYAAPLDAEVKSLVWYSPRVFAARGYAVPTSWDGLLELSRRVMADGGVPWCPDPDPDTDPGAAAGGPGAGGSLVDSLEDAVLSSAGPELFDAWVEHRIPTDAPQVAAALDGLAPILRRDAAGGTGGSVAEGSRDPASAATSTPGSADSSPITSGSCVLSRADSDAGDWPLGTVIAADGDVFAFRLPARSPDIGSTADALAAAEASWPPR